jgi:hypothetical protein
MEEDRETRTDEEVEAHVARARSDEAEGDDVEGHLLKGQQKARSEEADDDDVEAHVLRNAVARGVTKS